MGAEAPIMIGASRYVSCARWLGEVKSILVVGDRENHIKKAYRDVIPAIYPHRIDGKTTSKVDWDSFEGTVFVSS